MSVPEYKPVPVTVKAAEPGNVLFEKVTVYSMPWASVLPPAATVSAGSIALPV